MTTCKKYAYCSFERLHIMISFNCVVFCHPAITVIFLLLRLFNFYLLPEKRFVLFSPFPMGSPGFVIPILFSFY